MVPTNGSTVVKSSVAITVIPGNVGIEGPLHLKPIAPIAQIEERRFYGTYLEPPKDHKLGGTFMGRELQLGRRRPT